MKRWHWITLGVLTILSLIVEFTLVHHHGEHWWSDIPAFYIFWGFIGCVVTIYISRLLGQLFILRDEEYYDN